MNVTPYLKDIDNEIAHLRESIARFRLKISELEDMRVLMMQREEYRAAMNGHGSPFGALHGAEIAIRDMDAGVLSQAAKNGLLPAPAMTEETKAERNRRYQAKHYAKKRAEAERARLKLNASGNLRGMVQHSASVDRPKTAATGKPERKYWSEILTLLKAAPESQFDTEGIIDRLGLGDLHGKARQPVYQALHEMRKRGLVERPHIGVYQLAAPQ